MSTIKEETKNRLNYTDDFIAKGGTIVELLKDVVFQKLVEKERKKLR